MFPSDTGLGASNSAAVVISDAAGRGMAGLGSSLSGGTTLAATGLQPAITLQPPLTVHYNLLPVSRGKTVAKRRWEAETRASPVRNSC